VWGEVPDSSVTWLRLGAAFLIIFVSFVVQKQDPPESSGVSCFSLRQTETCTPQCATGYVAKVDGDDDGLLYCFEKVLTPTTFRCAWSNSSMGEDQERERERERWQQKLLNCRDKDFSPIWPYIMNEVIARLIETAMTGEATYLLLSLCPSSLHPGQSLAASFGRYTTCPGTGSLIRRREWCSHNMSQYGTICQNPIQSIHPDSLSMEGFGRPFFSVFLVWVFQPRPAPEGAVDITLLAVF